MTCVSRQETILRGISGGLVMLLATTGWALEDTKTQIRMLGVSTGYIGAQPALYEVDVTDGATTFVMQVADVDNTDAIGWHGIDGELYHTTGGESWSNSEIAGEQAYRDHHTMMIVDVENEQLPLTSIYNANPPPADPPPNDVLATSGLPGPIPTWAYPFGLTGQRRTVDQNTDEYQTGAMGRGPNEFHAVRNFAWNRKEKLFYFSDQLGLYTMTPDGTPTKIASGDSYKGLEFYHPAPGETRLLAGLKDEPILKELNPGDGAQIGGDINLIYVDENGTETGAPAGIVGLAQHPVTGVLYGIDQAGGTQGRSLLEIDVDTGIATIVGNVDVDESHTLVGIEFLGWLQGDMDRDGDQDFDDIDDLVQALNDPAQYLIDKGIPARVNGDQDEDNDLDFDDIGGFVDILSGGQTAGAGVNVPEPTGWALAAVGLALLAIFRRRQRH